MKVLKSLFHAVGCAFWAFLASIVSGSAVAFALNNVALSSGNRDAIAIEMIFAQAFWPISALLTFTAFICVAVSSYRKATDTANEQAEDRERQLKDRIKAEVVAELNMGGSKLSDPPAPVAKPDSNGSASPPAR